MKWLTLMTLLISFNSFSQNVKIEEPEWDGEILYAPPNATKGISLERQEAAVKVKANAARMLTGIGSIKETYSIAGESSPVKIKPENNIVQFVYKAKDNAINPKDVIQIVEFEVQKNARVVLMGTSGTFSGVSQGGIRTIDFKAEKYGKSSYLITLSGLNPGEYGFSLGNVATHIVYLFSLQGDNLTETSKSGRLFDDFFEEQHPDKLNKDRAVFIKKGKNSDDYDIAIQNALLNNNIKTEKEQITDDVYILSYYIGTFERTGKDLKCLQIKITDMKLKKSICQYSTKISNNEKKIVDELINTVIKNL